MQRNLFMFTVIASKPNTASINIASRLLENFDWSETGREFDGEPVRAWAKGDVELVFTDTLHVFANNVGAIETDCFVFVSSHKSESGKPSLTTHPIGNWGKAELGGKDKTLVPVLPGLMKNYLQLLQKKRDEMNLDYDVSLEATHHGPFLSKPALFIEIGSSEKQWADEKAALAVAESVMEGIIAKEGKEFVNCVGLGGQHYPYEFTKLELNSEFAFGHMCAKHSLSLLDSSLLQNAIELSNAKKIVLDWKGLGTEKARIKDLAESSGLEVLRSKAVAKQ
ncbi:MAG: D-aminoacyl-tRNA deacylase [archaeon]|nr:D-aminoacyl-tRNA deacylase [archaeon]